MANTPWIIEKARVPEKTFTSDLLTTPKPCVEHNKLRKILHETGILDHLTCLLRNLYAGQEVAVRTGHGTTDWFQIMKGVHQGCIFRSLKQTFMTCNFTSISECPREQLNLLSPLV